jgi:ankyrin repeat protein
MRKLLIISALCFSGLVRAGAYDDILAAANNSDTGAVVDLLRRGMDVNTSDRAGSTLLMIAARTGNQALLESLLANRAGVNRRNQFGDSAVMVAALNGKLAAVQSLIGSGAELNNDGWTPLHYAVVGGDPKVVALLLAKGAKPDARAPNGQTALMLAVKDGKLELVKLLIDADADMDLADYGGVSSLQLAKRLGHELIAEYLRKQGAVE